MAVPEIGLRSEEGAESACGSGLGSEEPGAKRMGGVMRNLYLEKKNLNARETANVRILGADRFIASRIQ